VASNQVRIIGGTEGRSALTELRELVGELVASRDLLSQLTIRDIKLRYKQAVMGFGWALLMPILVVPPGASSGSRYRARPAMGWASRAWPA